jgi:hypothetical protein
MNITLKKRKIVNIIINISRIFLYSVAFLGDKIVPRPDQD